MNATLPTGTVPARGHSHTNQVRTPCWCARTSSTSAVPTVPAAAA